MATGDYKYEVMETCSNLEGYLPSIKQLAKSKNEDSSCDISTNKNDQWTNLIERAHKVVYGMAHDYIRKRRFARALDLFMEIYEGAESVFGRHHDVTLDAESNLALTHKLDGRLDISLKVYKHMHMILRNNAQFDPERTIQIVHSIAGILKRQKKYDQAFYYYDLLEDGTKYQCDMAKALYTRGKYKEALKIYIKMYMRDAERDGKDDPETTLIHKHCVGKMLSCMNKHKDASRVYRQVIEARKKSFREFPELCANVIEDFAHLFPDLTDTRKGMRFLRNLHLEASTSLGPEHEYTLFVLFHIGYAYASCRMYRKALDVYEDLFEKQMNKDSESIDAVQMHFPIVNMHMALGNYSEALKVLDEAKEKFKLFENCDISFKNVINLYFERTQLFIECFSSVTGFKQRTYDTLILGLLMPWLKNW